MMGRTHQQHALPLTFGFILAGWAKEIRDQNDRLRESGKRHLLGSIVGGVGAQNAFVELVGEERARLLESRVCQSLGLSTPLISLHSRTDRFAEVVGILSAICSSLGKMGMSVASWQRTEVMEAEERSSEQRFGSSTMPNKLNPEQSEQVDGLAKTVRGLASALQDVLMQDQRDSTRIPVQYSSIPISYMMTSKALTTITSTLENLVVNEGNMLANLTHPNYLGQAAGERIMIRLYQKTGKRDWAHTVLRECAQRCREGSLWFRDVVSEHADIGHHFTDAELDEIFDLSTYTGTARRQTDDTVQSLRATRPEIDTPA
jgi:adenylosuccinate lyase